MINERKIQGIIFLLIFLGVLLGIAFFKKIFSDNYPFKDTVIATGIIISSEWKEIDAKNLLKLERDKQFLVLILEDPFEVNLSKKGVKTQNGEIINPEIKLVDEQGQEFPLFFDGSRGRMAAIYRYNGELPKDKIYKKVLLKSDYLIKTQKILWTCYFRKDIK